MELTAKEAQMNLMGNAYEQAQSIMEKPDLSKEDIANAAELIKVFNDLYDRYAKDEMNVEEMNYKYYVKEAEAKKDEEEMKFNKQEAEKNAKNIKIENAIKIGGIILSGAITIGVAVVKGKHVNRLALAETASMIGTKEAFRVAENAFNDSLKNVGKVIS